MNPQRIFIIIVLSILNIDAYSQSQLGIKQGLSSTYISKYYDVENYDAKPLLGISTGIILKYTAKPQNISFLTSVQYVTKNYLIVNRNYLNIYQKNYNSFLESPLKLQYNLKKNNITAFINSGILISFWIHSRTEQNIPDIFNSRLDDDGTEIIKLFESKNVHNFEKNFDNRIQFGIESSIGVEYSLNTNLTSFLSFSHQHVFTDYVKQNRQIYPKHNVVFILDAGVSIRI